MMSRNAACRCSISSTQRSSNARSRIGLPSARVCAARARAVALYGRLFDAHLNFSSHGHDTVRSYPIDLPRWL